MRIWNRKLDIAFDHMLMLSSDDRSLPTKSAHSLYQFGSGNGRQLHIQTVSQK